MLKPTSGWKLAPKLITYVLQPLKNIAQAVLINSAFQGGFDAVYSSPLSQHIDVSIDWGLYHVCSENETGRLQEPQGVQCQDKANTNTDSLDNLGLCNEADTNSLSDLGSCDIADADSLDELGLCDDDKSVAQTSSTGLGKCQQLLLHPNTGSHQEMGEMCRAQCYKL